MLQQRSLIKNGLMFINRILKVLFLFKIVHCVLYYKEIFMKTKYRYILKSNQSLSLATFSSNSIEEENFLGIACEESIKDIEAFSALDLEKYDIDWIDLDKFYIVPESVNIVEFFNDIDRKA